MWVEVANKVFFRLLLIYFCEACLCYTFVIPDTIGQECFDYLFIVVNTMVNLMVVTSCCKKYYVLFTALFLSSFAALWMLILYQDPDYTIALFKQWDVYGYDGTARYLLSQENKYGHTEFYAYIVYVIYSAFGVSQRIASFINFTCSLIAGLLIYDILRYLKINERICTIVAIVYLLMPWKLELSLYVLRESMPGLLIVESSYFFIKWYFSSRYKYIIISFLCGLLSLPFHAGLFLVPLTFLTIGLLYYPKVNKFIVTQKTILISAVMLMFALLIAYRADFFLYKLSLFDITNSDAIESFSDTWTTMEVGSSYLTWLSYSSLTDIIIQSPLRAFYFLYSPLPWDWRGIKDAIPFFLDSLIQGGFMVYILKNYNCVKREDRLLIIIFMFIFIAESLVYGIATFNSGTALRHRNKYISILFIMMSLVYDRKKFDDANKRCSGDA